MNKKNLKILLLTLTLICIFCSSLTISASAATYKGFQGKTISILGDSISTYQNYSSGNSADTTNSTIRNNRDYYYDGRYELTVKDTWWIQAKHALDAKILVNNSISGSAIFLPNKPQAEAGYYTRAVNLHDNTGKNSGQKPDIIVVYIGTNDFSYHKSKLGTSGEVNYSKLITKNGSDYTYQEPKTSCEAYAIMLHKIRTKYKNAEVYCFTSLQRPTDSVSETKLLESFNNSLKSIAKHYGCYVVDLYNNSGITTNEKVLNRYLYDGYLHPNKRGMDAITSAFLSSLYANSKYAPKKENVFNVTYNLSNVILNEGKLTKTIRNTPFECSFSKLTYGKCNVRVTMNGKDVTAKYYANGKISIPQVTGNIVISAKVSKVNRSFPSYRFLNKNNTIINVATNENTKNIIRKNTSGSYKIGNKIKLFYDTPWTIVFRTNNYVKDYNVILSSTDDNGYRLVLNQAQNIIGFANNTNKTKIFGYNFKSLKLDHTKAHTYKITNQYNVDGTNIFTLFIDNLKVGEFNTCYINGKYYNKKSFLNERNFVFDTIGSKYSHVLSYLQSWADDSLTDHVHTYGYKRTIKVSCATAGYVSTSCDCGMERKQITAKRLPHKESNWIISKEASARFPGEAYKKCSVCKNITRTKALPQLVCSKPVISQLINTENGVKITWKAVSGADSYRVFHRLENGDWAFICETTSTTYCDKNVNSGHLYHYTVKACNEAGYSAYDEVGKKIEFLATPTIKSLYNVDCGTKMLISPVNGAKGYYVYRKVGNGNWAYYKSTTSSTFIDKNVSNGKNYAYRVKAYSSNTVSGFVYNPKTVLFVATPKVKTPINTDSGIKLPYDKVSGAKEYYVYRKNTKNGWDYLGKSTSSSFTDTTAVPGKKYTYIVKAYNSKGYISGFTPGGVTSIRLVTPQPTGHSVLSNGIKLRWSAVTGAKGYYVYRKTGNNDGWTYLGKTSSTSYIDTTAKKGIKYLYIVKAYNGTYTSTYKASGITAKR